MKKEFSYPRSFKRGIVFAVILTLFFSSAALLFLLVQFNQLPDSVKNFIFISAVLLLILFRYLYGICIRMKEKILVDNDLLVYIKANGGSVSLSRGEIGRIEEHPYQQRLTVYDHSESIAIPVEYQLEGFDQLREWILSCSDYLDDAVLGQKTFHPHGLKVKSAVFCLLLFPGSIYFIPDDFQMSNEGMSVLIFMGGFLFVLIKNVWSLRIEIDHVVLRYPLRKKVVFFKNIQSIQMINENKYNNALSVVLVVLNNENKIRLTYFKEGSIALYRSLHHAWRNCGRNSNHTESIH